MKELSFVLWFIIIPSINKGMPAKLETLNLMTNSMYQKRNTINTYIKRVLNTEQFLSFSFSNQLTPILGKWILTTQLLLAKIYPLFTETIQQLRKNTHKTQFS